MKLSDLKEGDRFMFENGSILYTYTKYSLKLKAYKYQNGLRKKYLTKHNKNIIKFRESK